ncbi:MAG: hypothetical protein QXL52_04665 [Nitrososphaerales archaeon]
MKNKKNPKYKLVSKRELEKFVKKNKPTRFIAHYFNVSERTIYRRIKEYGLKGIRKKGKKPRIKKPKPLKKVKEWIRIKDYIDELDEIYHFYNIQYPPYEYINLFTLVCSNEKQNPEGKFTTVGIYYIAKESDLYFLYVISVRYKIEPVSFEEIFSWITKNASDIVRASLENRGISFEGLVAFTFYKKRKKEKNEERNIG